jgi:RNA polymerase sigma factor (sigma-70 family)
MHRGSEQEQCRRVRIRETGQSLPADDRYQAVMAAAPDDDEPAEPLLLAAKAGAAWAWREIFESLSPAVAGYLRIQGVHDVDDVVADVFMGVVRRIGAFEGSMVQFRSWVFVIAHHRLVDDRRRRARSSIVSYDDRDLADEAPPAADAASDALDRMSAARVIELCQRLVPDQRDVLLLRLVGDLTIEQIAETVEKSIGAVKALQRRGLAALQKILVHEGVPL